MNGMTKTYGESPSVLVKILYNILYLQIKEKVLLYTQNCVTIGTINIKNFYDPTYTTKFSGACWDKEKIVSSVQLTTCFLFSSSKYILYMLKFTLFVTFLSNRYGFCSFRFMT